MNRSSITLTLLISLAYSAVLAMFASPLSSVCVIKLAWM